MDFLEKPKKRKLGVGGATGIKSKKRPDYIVPPIDSWLDAIHGPRRKDIHDIEGVEGLEVYQDVKCKIEDWTVMDRA